MVCEQRIFRSARHPLLAALLLLVFSLLAETGLGDRSSEEKRNKKLAAQQASLASGKDLAQQSEKDPSQDPATQNVNTAEDVVDTMVRLDAKRKTLLQEQEELSQKLLTEANSLSAANNSLNKLQGDLKSMQFSKEVCANRIDHARGKLSDMSAEYQMLIACAEEAITCLKGSCPNAENMLCNINIGAEGKEALKRLEQTVQRTDEENAELKQIEDLAQESTSKAQEPTSKTQGNPDVVETQPADSGGFFKPDIHVSTTEENPAENSVRKEATTGGQVDANSDFFTVDSIKELRDQFGDPKTGDSTTGATTDVKIATTEGTPEDFCKEGALAGKWYHKGVQPETIFDNKKPEAIEGTKVIFSDGHEEDFDCAIENGSSKITLKGEAGAACREQSSEEDCKGKVEEDGSKISWTDGDVWEKKA